MDLSKPAWRRSTTAVGVTLGVLGLVALAVGAVSASWTAPSEGREAVSAFVAAAPIRLKSARYTDKKSTEGLRGRSIVASLFLKLKAPAFNLSWNDPWLRNIGREAFL
jgi:hypothetical protein